MLAGGLRNLGRFERSVATRTSAGASKDQWQTYAEAWAEIMPRAMRDGLQDARIVTDATHQIRVRWIAGILPTHRFVWHDHAENRTRVLEIVSVANLEGRNREMLLDCKEPVAP